MSIERLDLICTGGIYEDPDHGPTPRHPRQKLGRWLVQRGDHIGDVGESRSVRSCPQCGRKTQIGMATPADGERIDGVSAAYAGGVWEKILSWANINFPDRRVFVVDISDRRYNL